MAASSSIGPPGNGPMELERVRFLETVRTAAEANARIVQRLQGTDRWRSPCFEFVRRLRWEPTLRGLTGEQAAEVVEVALREIYPEAGELLWEQVLGHNDTGGQQVDPFTDFLLCWDNIRETPSLLETALEEVRADPESAEAFLGGRLRAAGWKPFREFLALLNRLQIHAGPGRIWPAVEPVAALLGVSPQQVSRWRKMALKRGYLDLVADSYPGHAAEFRFHPDPGSEESDAER